MSRAFTATQRLEVASTLLTAYPYSIALWVNDTGTETTFPFLVTFYTNGTSAGGTYFTVFIDNTGKLAGPGVTATVTRPTNTWFHACTVQTNATSHAIFQDGGNKITSATSATIPAGINRTSINAWNSGTNVGIVGSIAHVAIWNVALADAEVAMLANGLSPLLVRPNAITNYWPLSGQTLASEAGIIGGNTMVNFSSTIGTSEPRIQLPQGLL